MSGGAPEAPGRQRTPTPGDLLTLVIEQLCAVMAVDRDRVRPETRLSEDLHADSLDRVEMIERVEEALRRRGVAVRVPQDELAGLQTVGQAADRLHFLVRGAEER